MNALEDNHDVSAPGLLSAKKWLENTFGDTVQLVPTSQHRSWDSVRLRDVQKIVCEIHKPIAKFDLIQDREQKIVGYVDQGKRSRLEKIENEPESYHTLVFGMLKECELVSHPFQIVSLTLHPEPTGDLLRVLVATRKDSEIQKSVVVEIIPQRRAIVSIRPVELDNDI